MASMVPSAGQSVADWEPPNGLAERSMDKLMNTEAREDPLAVSDTNVLKQMVWKGKKPSPPFGQKGRAF